MLRQIQRNKKMKKNDNAHARPTTCLVECAGKGRRRSGAGHSQKMKKKFKKKQKKTKKLQRADASRMARQTCWQKRSGRRRGFAAQFVFLTSSARCSCRRSLCSHRRTSRAAPPRVASASSGGGRRPTTMASASKIMVAGAGNSYCRCVLAKT